MTSAPELGRGKPPPGQGFEPTQTQETSPRHGGSVESPKAVLSLRKEEKKIWKRLSDVIFSVALKSSQAG